MTLIPKKTKFRLSFRNKIKTKKIKKFDFKQHKPFCAQFKTTIHRTTDVLNKKNAWCPNQYANFAKITLKHDLNYTTHQILWSQQNKSITCFQPFENLQITKLLKNSNFLCNLQSPKLNCRDYNLIGIDQAASTSAITPKISNNLLFGTYGFCAMRHGTVTTKFVDTARLDIAKKLRKKGRIWTRICCDTPVTARPIETRMGKGKGAITHWEAKIQPGQLLFEFSGVSKPNIIEIFNNLNKKSAIKLKLICN